MQQKPKQRRKGLLWVALPLLLSLALYLLPNH